MKHQADDSNDISSLFLQKIRNESVVCCNIALLFKGEHVLLPTKHRNVLDQQHILGPFQNHVHVHTLLLNTYFQPV